MYKGIIESSNIGLGLKLINSISFSESVISTGYILKTANVDLHVRSNNAIPPRNLRGKVLEDSSRLSTEADTKGVTCGAGRPHLQVVQPVGPSISLSIAMAVLHRLLGCI
jgi:hypothetical protein